VDGLNGVAIASVGQRVKQERLARKLKLADVSRGCGISVPMLSKFENGRISLNFRHLLEIARVLNVPVNRFLNRPVESAITGRRSVTRAGEGMVQRSKGVEYRTLCDDLTDRSNAFWKATIHSRTLEEYGELSSHPGEEFILVLKGEMVLHSAAYKPLLLGQGDSVCFDGMVPHAYLAVSPEPPEVLMSNTIDRDMVAEQQGVPGVPGETGDGEVGSAAGHVSAR